MTFRCEQFLDMDIDTCAEAKDQTGMSTIQDEVAPSQENLSRRRDHHFRHEKTDRPSSGSRRISVLGREGDRTSYVACLSLTISAIQSEVLFTLRGCHRGMEKGNIEGARCGT